MINCGGITCQRGDFSEGGRKIFRDYGLYRMWFVDIEMDRRGGSKWRAKGSSRC